LIAALPALTELESQWRELEARADASFFNSWSWIGHWLARLPSHIKPQLVRASGSGKTLALCVLVHGRLVRHGFMPVHTGCVNSTGVETLDALMIEYNDVLCDRDCGPAIRGQVLRKVLHSRRMEELRVDGVRIDACWPGISPPGFTITVLERIARGVDLKEVREAGGEFLPLISANTRSKIRKAFKDTAKMGELRLELPQDIAQAEAMYDALCHLHGAAWSERGEPGAFANPFLLDFHRELIRARYASGEIQLIGVRAGELLLGVLYNFVHRGRVYSYQSGFDFTLGPKQYKPGLLAHTMAIEHNARLGHDYYDFMAGDSQYKRSLGTRSDTLQWVVFQRDSFKFRIENGLRALKQRIQNRQARQVPETGATATEDQA
jgi:CelD/BcsL family acetyltransferase involved in cellulose biosynthesis